MAARPAPSSSAAAPRTVIPKLTTDPSASLQPAPLTVRAASSEYHIGAFPAATWLALLMDEESSWYDFFPGLADDGTQQAVEEAILAGSFSFDDQRDLVLDMVTTVAGRPWWVTMRLVSIVAGNWDYLGGELVLKGVDPTRLALGAWLDAAFHLILRSMDSKEHTKFLVALEKVPAGEAVTQPEPEMTAAAFGALMR